MAKLIYRKGSFTILSARHGYIVYNTQKDFNCGHTHLNNFYVAKQAIYYVMNNEIPKRAGEYFLESLLRLTNNKKYAEQLKLEIEMKRAFRRR